MWVLKVFLFQSTIPYESTFPYSLVYNKKALSIFSFLAAHRPQVGLWAACSTRKTSVGQILFLTFTPNIQQEYSHFFTFKLTLLLMY